MTKIKRILTFITAVMVLFTVSIAFAGCDDRRDVTVYLYLVNSYDHVSFKEDMDRNVAYGSTILLRQWSKDKKPEDNDPIVLYFEEVKGRYLMACYTDGIATESAEWSEPKTILNEFGYRTVADGGTCMAAIQRDSMWNDYLPEPTTPAFRIKEAETYHFGFRITENDKWYYPLWGSCKIIIEDC